MTKKKTDATREAEQNLNDLRKTYSMFKLDGWVNILAGIDRYSDKTRVTYFGDYETLEDDALTRMWLGEGIGKKIVSCVADDMTRNWIEIEGDTENKIMKELTRLNVETEVNKALKWARLYGGAIIIVGANDGRKLEEPLNVKGVKSIDWLKTYSSARVNVSNTDIVTDVSSPYFEDVEIFQVHKKDGNIVPVHQSRCMVFKGDPVPDEAGDIGTNSLYWGASILQSIYQRLKNFGAIEQSLANLMMEIIIGKYTLSNLAELLSEDNTEAVYARLQIINASKSIINGVLLGENEKYERDSANVAGVPELMDRFMMCLSAVAEIPVTRLFGRSPAGQNATGESDERIYYDMVGSKQKTWLKPGLQYLISLMNVYLKVGKDPAIMFNSIWEPTQKELVEMRKVQAETDHIYINDSVLTPEQVAEQRFVGGYSFETSLEEEDLKDMEEKEEPPPKPEEEEEEEE